MVACRLESMLILALELFVYVAGTIDLFQPISYSFVHKQIALQAQTRSALKRCES